VLEWGWLAALMFTPLFFNVYSSRVFEPDKLSMLRSIVLVMAVAWAIKVLEGLNLGRTANATARGGTATVSAGWPVSRWWRIPLLVPILLYAILFLITSFASVTPYASIFGSYQRLQGLVSQYAYIMLALILIFNLRTRAQIERLITFAIVTAAPVALYGLIQHLGWDPLPWAGDVQSRVASSMGNAIFVAAWLIMIVPLMLYRIATLLDRLFSKKSDLEPQVRDDDALMALGYAGVVLVQNFVLWVALKMMASNQTPDFGLWFILPTAIAIFYGMTFIYGTARKSSRWFAWAQLVGISLLLLITLTVIIFAQSRGPLLGLVAGLAFFGAAGFAIMKKRLPLVVAGAAFALIIAIHLIFYLPGSPFASESAAASADRLGQITQTDEGTGKVRLLIWQGGFNLIKSDPVRMMMGWGPESMYVAYNKFYPAELQHWELRNATPDRSHNAYIDQVITMGAGGLLLYLLMTCSFFFFIYRYLGFGSWASVGGALLTTPGSAGLVYGFLLIIYPHVQNVLGITGGLSSLVGALFSAMIVVSIPLIVYFLIVRPKAQVTDLPSSVPTAAGIESSTSSQILVLALGGMVVAHLVEIAVGIQIAATYTYFYAAMGTFVALAFFVEKKLQVNLEELGEQVKDATANLAEQPKGKIGVFGRVSEALQSRPTLALAGAGSGAGPITVAFATTSNRGGSGTQSGNPRKGSGNRNKANQPPTRPTIVAPPRPANASATAPATDGNATTPTNGSSASKANAVVSGTPVTAAPATVKPQSQIQRASSRQRVASGRVDQARVRPLTRWVNNTAFLWVYGALAIAAILFIWLVNVNLVYADMLYKQGQSADAQRAWPQSVQLYQEAINLQPDQDYYYLFMGRSYMEWSKSPGSFQQLTADQVTSVRDQLIARSEQTLLKARAMNPMNTDHYANLGRLYVYWGGVLSGSAATQQQGLDKLQQGVNYYQQAVQLSPQNAQIWNELAMAQRSLALYVNQLNAPAQGKAGASSAPTSTQAITGSGTVSATNGVTSTGTVSATNGITSTAITTSTDATALKMPVRGDNVGPQAMPLLEAAEKTIDHTINVVDDKFAASYFIKGEIERSLSDAPKAADAYVKMITLVPVGNDTPSLASLADNEITQRSEFLVAGKVYTQVIDALKLVTTPNPTDEQKKANPATGLYTSSKDGHNFLGFLYWKSNQLPLAIAELQKVEQLDSSDYFAHRNLSVLYGLNKQPDKQLQELVQCRTILSGANWTSFFSTQQEHDQELASVNATIQQVQQANPSLKAPASPQPSQPPAAP